MATTVFCKTVSKGRQAFYLKTNKETYFLFEQNFRIGNKDFFQNGYSFYDGISYKNVHNTAVRNILEKLIPYISYIEKEYSICILKKTQKKQRVVKNSRYSYRYNEDFDDAA